MKLHLKRLINAAFGAAEELSLKKLRRRTCDAAEQACSAAGEPPPDRPALEAAFAAKLAKLPFVVAGKRVRRAVPEAVEEEEEQLNEAEEGSPERPLRPSEVAWFGPTPGHAQRFGAFSSDERSTLDAAVAVLAQEEGESEEDLSWLFATRVSGKRGRRFWLQLAVALPSRSPRQVWGHATRRLHPARRGLVKGARWDEEEDTDLREAVEEHGHDWVAVGQVLDRPPDVCRDRWRKLDGRRSTGAWAEAEVEALRVAVAAQLAAPPPAPKPGTGRAFTARDNVSWAAVSAALGGGRSAAQCLDKYYRSVAPSMVAAGTWAKADDQALLTALHAAAAEEASALDWAALVPGRGAPEALRRWKLMLKHVPEAVDVGFPGCVAFLHQRFGRPAPAVGASGTGGAAAAEGEAVATQAGLKKRRRTRL